MRDIKFRSWNEDEKVMIDGDSLAFEDYAPISELLSQDGIMQFTGLKDMNGLKDIYEGDIIDIEGTIRGNIYETPDKRRTDLIIGGMGTTAWRDTEQTAMDRGCRYAS